MKNPKNVRRNLKGICKKVDYIVNQFYIVVASLKKVFYLLFRSCYEENKKLNTRQGATQFAM